MIIQIGFELNVSIEQVVRKHRREKADAIKIEEETQKNEIRYKI
jgi:hypothetical protein